MREGHDHWTSEPSDEDLDAAIAAVDRTHPRSAVTGHAAALAEAVRVAADAGRCRALNSKYEDAVEAITGYGLEARGKPLADRIRALGADWDRERTAHRATLDALALARRQHAAALTRCEADLYDCVHTMRAAQGAFYELRRRVKFIFDSHPIREWGAFDCNLIHEAMNESTAALEESFLNSINGRTHADGVQRRDYREAK